MMKKEDELSKSNVSKLLSKYSRKYPDINFRWMGKGMETKLQIGEIIGYRCWIVKNDSLWSTFHCYLEWKSGIQLAQAWIDDYLETDFIEITKELMTLFNISRFGYYAFNDPSIVEKYIIDTCSLNFQTVAVGTVWMWGDVMEHDRGYRATHCSVRSIERIGVKDILTWKTEVATWKTEMGKIAKESRIAEDFEIVKSPHESELLEKLRKKYITTTDQFEV